MNCRKSEEECQYIPRMWERNIMPLKNGTNDTVTMSGPKSHKADYQILLQLQKCRMVAQQIKTSYSARVIPSLNDWITGSLT